MWEGMCEREKKERERRRGRWIRINEARYQGLAVCLLFCLKQCAQWYIGNNPYSLVFDG